MMMSSNGNIFRVTFPSQRLMTRNIDVFFDLRLNKRLSRRWFETPSRRYYDVTVMMIMSADDLTFALPGYNHGFFLPYRKIDPPGRILATLVLKMMENANIFLHTSTKHFNMWTVLIQFSMLRWSPTDASPSDLSGLFQGMKVRG